MNLLNRHFEKKYLCWLFHVQIYGNDNKINEFLNQALTPIVAFICTRNRSISYIFSTIEYTTLKNVCITKLKKKSKTDFPFVLETYRAIKEYY